MKFQILFLALTFFYILSCINTIIAQDRHPVLDTTKASIQSGVQYYILPVGKGGGLSVSSPLNISCQELGIVSPAEPGSNGMQISFTPSNSNEGVVILSSDITIRFSTILGICGLETIWTIVPFQGQEFVAIGGVEGKTLFRIEAEEGDYKLVYHNGTYWRDVVVVEQDGKNYLVLATGDRDRAFKVRFKKSPNRSK